MVLNAKDTRNMIMAFITAFLDVINFSLVVPILPAIIEELKATSMESGILYSGYSFFQLISLWFMGRYSDVYGRKIFLILSLFGSCFGSIFQAASKTIWQLIFFRALTGLFAGSIILVQAVIADLTPPEDRNKYYSRLDAVNSAAFILGPALGGFLNLVNNRFPLYIGGIVSGIALFFSFFYLKETSKDVKIVYELRDKMKKLSPPERTAIKEEVKHKMSVIKLKRKQIKPKVTSIMILCFLFEFCNRWVINAFDAKYGLFAGKKFGITSSVFSTIVCLTSVSTCFLQAVVYPLLVGKIGIPVVYISIFGMCLQTIAYVVMALTPKWFSVGGSVLLWAGFTLCSPTSVSIISTTNISEVQGTVLSWNNIYNQCSLIICPLVLSVVYEWNNDAMYLSCTVFSVVGVMVMMVMSTWPNAKLLGKKSSVKEMKIEVEVEVEVEIKEMEKREENETPVDNREIHTSIDGDIEKQKSI